MKKTIIFLALILAVSLTACQNTATTDTPDAGANDAVQSEQQDASAGAEKDDDNSGSTAEKLKKAKETDASSFEYESIDGGICITDYTGTDSLVVIPNEIDGKKVVSIGELAFYDYPHIVGVKLGDNVTEIQSRSFMQCTQLETFISGSGLKVMCDNALAWCEKLQTVELNDGLEKIGDSCFFPSGVLRIDIPDSVTEIVLPFSSSGKDVDIVIVGSEGSEAQKYVEEYGSEFGLVFEVRQ